MESLQPRHLVLVRHGESEGDVRRIEGTQALKHPKNEKQTEAGHKQSQAAGLWIAKYILEVYGFGHFDQYLTSPLVRTKQSAYSLGLAESWTEEPRLTERNRGDIQGLTKQQHKEKYPESYKAMHDHPIYWVPPSGESILAVSHRFGTVIDELANAGSVLIMTHRDVIWAAHVPLDGFALDDVERMDTGSIYNGQVVHYTNINPNSGAIEGTELTWKRSVDPSVATQVAQDSEWVSLASLLKQV